MISDDIMGMRLALERCVAIDGKINQSGPAAEMLLYRLRVFEDQVRMLEHTVLPKASADPMLNADDTNVVPFNIWHREDRRRKP